MEKILVNDRWFRPYLGAEEISQAVDNLAARMSDELRDKDPLFLVVLNGAFIFAADLVRKLDFPCRISFIRLSSYSGTNSTQHVRDLIGLHEDISGQNIVIVEDIVDTGHTLKHLLDTLSLKSPASIRIATLLFKPDAFVHEYSVNYVALEIPPDFIIGYGLDYDGHGRNLSDIYQIVND
jgi:hypoxanthine phosphoribosyltransferase